MRLCHNCGHDWGMHGAVGIHATCPGCEQHVHCCANCKWLTGHGRCGLTTTDPTKDPEERNGCEEFVWWDDDGRGRQYKGRGRFPKKVSGDEAKKRFDALFGDG